MAKDKRWIQRAVKKPGSFTAQAKRRGMSPAEFQRAVLSNPKGYNTTTVRRANLRKTLVSMESGGMMGAEEFGLGGWLKDNMQGVLGGLKIAGGIGLSIASGGSLAGPGLALAGSGAQDIGAEIGGDKAAKMQQDMFNQQMSMAENQQKMMSNQMAQQNKIRLAAEAAAGKAIAQRRSDAYMSQVESNQAVNPFTPTFKCGGRMRKFPMGGLLPYYQQGGLVAAEGEDNEVLARPNGRMTKLEGPTHEEGGIDLLEPAGTMVFSDRVIYKPTGKTFAEEADRIRKQMAKLDKQLA